MKCRFNLYLLVAVVFILAIGYAAAQTQLLGASEKGDADILKALLAHGADVNAKCNNDLAALMIAKKKGIKRSFAFSRKQWPRNEGTSIYSGFSDLAKTNDYQTRP
jgi:hypothetical protein